MFKTSEQLLKIAVEKYKKTNNSEVELEYEEYSGIVGIDGNIEDVLDDLIRNGMIGAMSKRTLNIIMGFKLFLTSIVEDIDEGKTGEKQAGRWWNRLSRISDVVTIGTTACNLLPVVQENLPAILAFIQRMIHTA